MCRHGVLELRGAGRACANQAPACACACGAPKQAARVGLVCTPSRVCRVVLRGRGGAIGAEFCAAKCQHSQAEMRTSVWRRIPWIPRHYFP